MDAALEVFVEKGYAAARLEDVARRAGVTKGTIYLYFPSKEELFRDVVRHTVGDAIDDLEQNQSTDFLDTARNTVDWQNDVAISGRNTLTAGLLWQDEEADALSFGLPYAAGTATAQALRQG